MKERLRKIAKYYKGIIQSKKICTKGEYNV